MHNLITKKVSILDDTDWSNLNCFILRAPTIWPMARYEVDLATTLHNAGGNVAISVCSGELEGCGANASSPVLLKRAICAECKSKQISVVDWLQRSNPKIKLVEFDKLCKEPTFLQFVKDLLPIISSENEMSQYFYFRLGHNCVLETALSTLMSFSNNPEPNILDNVNLLLKLLFDSYIATLVSRELIKTGGYDKFFIFNGRVTLYRPLMRELQHINRQDDLYIYEHPFTGGDNNIDRYLITKGGYHHDLHNFSKQLIKQFRLLDADRETWLEEGDNWLNDRVYSNLHKYKATVTRHQTQGFLPEQWDATSSNIVFYTSTESEWAGIPEMNEKRPFKTQFEAISWLIEKLPKKVELYVRIHPGNSPDSNVLRDKLSKIRCKQLHIIEYDSNVDSYALAKAANLIISFGSTISVEAAWLGANVLTLGPAAYSQFEVGHTVYHRSELLTKIDSIIASDKNAENNHKQNASKYIFTIKHCEHPINHSINKSIDTTRKALPEEFHPNIIIKLLVRFCFFPTNIKKSFRFTRQNQVHKMPVHQIFTLFKKLVWKNIP